MRLLLETPAHLVLKRVREHVFHHKAVVRIADAIVAIMGSSSHPGCHPMDALLRCDPSKGRPMLLMLGYEHYMQQTRGLQVLSDGMLVAWEMEKVAPPGQKPKCSSNPGNDTGWQVRIRVLSQPNLSADAPVYTAAIHKRTKGNPPPTTGVGWARIPEGVKAEVTINNDEEGYVGSAEHLRPGQVYHIFPDGWCGYRAAMISLDTLGLVLPTCAML